ncbi:hypothetical protein [Sedimentisphaera salicampi]|uniref:Uncharacterized protein n=1 Tax=Sedimentisphaera salicampi TaxID=1941349 RepID=A0A1W6LJ78_9BACT|nr:hypothetical protein [Sedimentisphaera salicampi]ARN55812.1 hypothetical protein STSP1_00178 [Sedimentisphaera salicampi]OXU16005.1 hypothetical protein SMSP1_00173 [Sedimentisphaera salicampi]
MPKRDCKKCNEKDGCGSVYNTLGHSDCKPVTLKVIAAFVVPILTFIISYSLLDNNFESSKGFSPAAAFFALIITAGVISVCSFLIKKLK